MNNARQKMAHFIVDMCKYARSTYDVDMMLIQVWKKYSEFHDKLKKTMKKPKPKMKVGLQFLARKEVDVFYCCDIVVVLCPNFYP